MLLRRALCTFADTYVIEALRRRIRSTRGLQVDDVAGCFVACRDEAGTKALVKANARAVLPSMTARMDLQPCSRANSLICSKTHAPILLPWSVPDKPLRGRQPRVIA